MIAHIVDRPGANLFILSNGWLGGPLTDFELFDCICEPLHLLDYHKLIGKMRIGILEITRNTYLPTTANRTAVLNLFLNTATCRRYDLSQSLSDLRTRQLVPWSHALAPFVSLGAAVALPSLSKLLKLFLLLILVFFQLLLVSSQWRLLSLSVYLSRYFNAVWSGSFRRPLFLLSAGQSDRLLSTC